MYEILISFQTKYPEGTPFTNDEKYNYTSTTILPNTIFTGSGCAAFALELSDAAFNGLTGRYSYDFDNVRVGDIVRINNDTHSVVVLEVNSDTITVCEANFNSSVHWGREISRTDTSSWNYIITRYPN